MAVAMNSDVRLIHALPGRLRVHAPHLATHDGTMATRILQLPGVRAVQANRLTGNLLVHFDRSSIEAQDLLMALCELVPPDRGTARHAAPALLLLPATNHCDDMRSQRRSAPVAIHSHGAKPRRPEPPDSPPASQALAAVTTRAHTMPRHMVIVARAAAGQAAERPLSAPVALTPWSVRAPSAGRTFGSLGGLVSLGAAVAALVSSGGVWGFIANGLEIARLCTDLLNRRQATAYQCRACGSAHVVVQRGRRA